MSDNPFSDPPKQPPVSASPYQAPPISKGSQSFPPTAPGALTPILVFCLIFGILGWIGNCVSGGGLMMLSFLETMINQADLPEEQAIFTKLQMSSQQPIMLPSIILIVINVFVATVLIIGSIGGFKRKESAWALRLGLLVAIFYSLCKGGVTIYGYFASQALMSAGVEKYAGEPIYDGLKTQLTMNQPLAIGGLIFGIVVSLAILGFYIWARGYLGKPEVEQHFAEVSRYKAGN